MASLLKAAIKYEAQEITKVRETNAMFYFSDGSQFNKKEFNKRLVVIREMREDAISQDDVYAALKKEVDTHLASRQKHMGEQIDRIKSEIQTLSKAAKAIGSSAPTNALRYIILRDNRGKSDAFVWYFATTYTSHTEMEQEYQSLYGRNFNAVAGGFYTSAQGNANTDLNFYWQKAEYQERRNVLMLFGKSDSFGLREDYFVTAVKQLKSTIGKRFEVRVMSNLSAKTALV